MCTDAEAVMMDDRSGSRVTLSGIAILPLGPRFNDTKRFRQVGDVGGETPPLSPSARDSGREETMPVLPHVHAVTSSAALIHHLSALDGSSSTRSTISSVTGSVSFFVWLFAQSPQIYKNYQRKSVEGLSLVFLFQWIAGDVLNLIGCILTRQLAFQVAVATWFVLVDVVLTAQVVCE